MNKVTDKRKPPKVTKQDLLNLLESIEKQKTPQDAMLYGAFDEEGREFLVKMGLKKDKIVII